MPRWKPAPVIGGAYSDDAKAWSDQDTVNWIPVVAERGGTRTPTMLRDAPGLIVISDLGTNAPIRGTHNVEGLLLAVSGNKLFKIGVDGAGTEIGTIPGVERVSMAHNQITGGNEVAIANGQSGYVYNTVTDTLVQITDDGFPGAISFDFCDSYIMGIEPGRRFGFHSQLAAAGDYNTLDRYEAEGSPDKLVGQIVTHREWWLFGERTIEPYTNTGAATGTFQRSSGTVIEVGAASRHAICQMDNSVFWLGGDGVVYRANGYTPVRISTHAIEQAIARCNTAQAFAFTFEDRGHKIFYLTFPDGQTWGYDAASGEWHRRQSYGLDRWRINTLTKWRGAWIAGDYSNGRLYQLDWNTSNEAGEVLERRRITGVLSDNHNRVNVNGVALEFDTGTREPASLLLRPPSILGDLPDGVSGDVVSYQYSITGGVLPRGDVIVTSGSIPGGLNINTTGLVTGTRGDAGKYAFILGVTDAAGTSATLSDESVTTSSDLLTWTTVSDGVNQSPLASCVSDGMAVIACNNGLLAVSEDSGVTWGSYNILPVMPNGAAQVAKFNGDWYLFGPQGLNQAAKTRGDAQLYTPIANAPSTLCVNVMDGRLYAGNYVFSGNYSLSRMEHPGAVWASIDTGIALASTGRGITGMAKTPTAYIFVTNDGSILRSTDLVTFTRVLSVNPTQLRNVAYSGGRIIATTFGPQWYLSVDDGLTWTLNSSLAMNYVVATASMFIGCYLASIYSSPDGVTWTTRVSGAIGAHMRPSVDGSLAVFPIQSGYVSVGTP